MKALKKKYGKGGLVGKQHKLDKNKDGKITGQDFKMMKNGGKVKRDGSKVTKAYTGNQPFTSDEIKAATRGKGKMTAGERKRLQKELLNSMLTPASKAPQKMRRLGVKKLGTDKSDLEARNRGLKKAGKGMKIKKKY